MTKRKRALLILLTIFFCIGADQITKCMVKSHLPYNKMFSFAGDTFRLDYHVNEGAVLTFEHNLPEPWRGRSFTLVVFALLAAILAFMMFAPGLRSISIVALSLFCGGALSNLLDRIAFGGDVVDFLNIGWGGLRTGIFNVADIGIAMGCALGALIALWNIIKMAAR